MVKNLPVNAGDTGDMGSIPGSGRSFEEGNGNPLQYSCLGHPMDRGTWWATVHGVAKESDITLQQSNNNRREARLAIKAHFFQFKLFSVSQMEKVYSFSVFQGGIYKILSHF